jgi:hypothetical protein
MSYYDSDMLYLKCGGRWEFWVNQINVIEQFMKSAAGKELTQVNVATHSAVKQEMKAASGKAILWDPTRGGMRMPHLHYAGEIFLLNEKQWEDFSKLAMQALTEKMGKMQKVTFEKVMQIAEGMS